MPEERIKKLGQKLKSIRLTNHISLRELAKLTGLTRSFLSQIERGISLPSITSLEKIARGLNTELSYFFKEDFPKDFSLFRRKRERKFLTKDSKTSCEVLVSDILDIAMVPLLFTLKRKAKIGEDLLWHYRKEKFMLTLKGKIELACGKVDKRKFILEEGDSIYCKCNLSCKEISNISNKEAEMLWVVKTPLL